MEPIKKPTSLQTILVVDFGSQTTHLIARRLKDLGVSSKIVTPDKAIQTVEKVKPLGIIFSGGPADVFAKKSPKINKQIFSFDIPILGICYGFQLIAYMLGGKVISGRKEYGPAEVTLKNKSHSLTKGMSKLSTVWMSHGNEIVSLPKDFIVLGSTSNVKYALTSHKQKKLYGLLFHPEVQHTEMGMKILRNFIALCKIKPKKYSLDISEMVGKIKNTVGDNHVIAAVSGGVDSTVAGVLVAKAIGKNFTPIFVDNGLMRDGAIATLQSVLKPYGIEPIIVHVEKEMLKKLKGVTDSEKKRKIIGKLYIDVFEREMKKLSRRYKNITFLMQGTIYSDVIESKGTKHAAKIKSHHNVGGLPPSMKLQLLEPLRELYKDEVRQLGTLLGLSESVVWKQVFPGPGFAVRIRGEVTPQRLSMAKQADTILLEELEKAGVLRNIYMSFPVMTGAYSTAVKGDGRTMEEVIALRIIESLDIMTTTWSRLPYDLLQKISSRIVNEVPGISRVVYDITTKPPATMEWE